MMSSPAMDTESDKRRESLNAYCLRMGWVSAKNTALGSPTELVKRLGRTNSFWSDRLRGAKMIGADLAREIEKALGMAKYSLDGEHDAADFVPVVRLSVEVGAGAGRQPTVVEDVGSLQFQRSFLRATGLSAASAAIVDVVGASMEPTIKDGAVLLINRADREPRPGLVYAFSLGDDVLVKRFFRSEHGWVASSDNPDKEAFPDISIDGSAPAVIQGRAVWMGAKL